ncbi:MAG: tRNA (adenosine(37)-N6)-threonylcarbamoyltransferase complex dimerization subunit type 1 TsaB [Proteobacteria bacterium]|nr:tRNA (adenosine(37)-N6)-threonylcarbamoyltransferase complex dimerization subunit type 1 TsaB [Pseudomonadota bacterium]MDA1237594.1 tRNA (adenosine(37)-N6)-threonylcarbamoyltransferase complex dimerization subunit type 1 TsaB [Pseudomonadota bacterium]
MQSKLNLLGFDTSAAHCAAALLKGGFLAEETFLPMQKGQAENLIPILESLLKSTYTSWTDLDGIAVGTGPGNFTGIRISVSAARGLALSLKIPVIGVSNFQLMNHDNPKSSLEKVQILSLPGPLGTAYIQLFKDDSPLGDAYQMPLDKICIDFFNYHEPIVIGYQAKLIAEKLGLNSFEKELSNIALNLTRIVEKKLMVGHLHSQRPTPLYIKAADASEAKEGKTPILT